MVVEDEDGRALKFRTRTRVEYARVRPGMVTEAVLVRVSGSAVGGGGGLQPVVSRLMWMCIIFSLQLSLIGLYSSCVCRILTQLLEVCL